MCMNVFFTACLISPIFQQDRKGFKEEFKNTKGTIKTIKLLPDKVNRWSHGSLFDLYKFLLQHEADS